MKILRTTKVCLNTSIHGYSLNGLLMILTFILLSSKSFAQKDELKIQEGLDEILTERSLSLKASQSYTAYKEFLEENNTKSFGSIFKNTVNIDVPGIGGRVRSILVDSDNDISLVAPSGGGLWRFESDGSLYEPLDDFAPFMTVTDIAQNPFNKNELIICTGDEYQFIQGNGLFKSTNKGITFDHIEGTDFDSERMFAFTRYIKYHPFRENEIYLVAQNRLFKSIDNGLSWKMVLDRLRNDIVANIKSIDFNSAGEVLISVDDMGIYKSSDGELNSFKLMTQGLPAGVQNNVLSACESNRDILYSMFEVVDQNSSSGVAGDIYKSVDGGNRWQKTGRTDFYVSAPWFVFNLKVHPSNSDIILAGSVGWGYSIDEGRTWVSGRGLEVDYHTFSFDKANDNIAYAGYDQGIGKISIDKTDLYWEHNGSEWVMVDQFLQEEIGKELGFNTSQIYYGDYYPSRYGDAIVFGQQDGGSFAHINGIDTRIFVGDGGSIFINNQDPNKIIGSTQRGKLHKTTQGLEPSYKNFERDTRFDNNHTNFITEFVSNESDGDQVYFSTLNGIERSLDFGDTFEPIANYNGLENVKMALSNQLDPTLYVVGINRESDYTSDIYKIENASSSSQLVKYESVLTFRERTDRVSIDSDDPSKLFLTTINGGAFKISVQGNSVTKTEIRGNANGLIFNIVINIPNDNIWLAGTNTGLLYSTNEGETWTLSKDIPHCQVRDIQYREDDKRLFVFTYGRGAWATTIDFDSNSLVDLDNDGYNVNEDCDDTNASINPGQQEIENNDVDENCDGIKLVIDEDRDGYNSDEDCDDNNSNVNPGAQEIENNDVDEDCDGTVLVIDNDNDGFNSDVDCDDSNSNINPGAQEIENNDIDENCDGTVLVIDNDNDGFNSDEDCDDNNSSINPGAQEIENNDIDEDCDGTVLVIDNDNDGFNSEEDCDDNNASINADAEDIPDNGIDENCDGADAVSSSTFEIQGVTLNIFPNPTSGRVDLVLDSNIDLEVKVLELSGKFTGIQTKVSRSGSIDLRSLVSNLYLIEITELSTGKKFVDRIFKVD